jgi:hypothetical protein
VFESELGVFSESEKVQLTKAYADFAEAQGIIDVPPGLALIIALGTIFIPKAMSPHGKTRILGFVDKAKNAVLNRS